MNLFARSKEGGVGSRKWVAGGRFNAGLFQPIAPCLRKYVTNFNIIELQQAGSSDSFVAPNQNPSIISPKSETKRLGVGKDCLSVPRPALRGKIQRADAVE